MALLLVLLLVQNSTGKCICMDFCHVYYKQIQYLLFLYHNNNIVYCSWS